MCAYMYPISVLGGAFMDSIGAVGGALLGIIFYGESKNIKRILFIGIILASTIGLKLIS